MKKKKFVCNEYNTRVTCICSSRTCYIFYRKVCIGELTEEKNDAGEFDWVIKIYWKEWSKVGEPFIPGIDTDLRLAEYVRAFLPVIVGQRKTQRVGQIYPEKWKDWVWIGMIGLNLWYVIMVYAVIIG